MITEVVSTTIGLFLAYFIFGFLVTNLVFKERNLWKNLPFMFAFSYLFLGFTIYLLGLFGQAIIENIIMIQILALVLLIFLVYEFKTSLKPQFSFPLKNKWVILVLVLFLALIFYEALLFPSTQADAVSYHLVIPEVINNYAELPNLENSANLREVMVSMTGLSHTFNSYFYMLGVPFMARFLSPFSFFMFILVVLSFCENFFNEKIKNWVVVLVFTAPIINALAINEYIEIQLLFLSTLAVYCFFLYQKNKKSKYLALALVFAGFCSLIKLTGILILIILFLFILIDYSREKKGKSYFYTLIPLGLLSIIIGQIIFWRNITVLGCSTYPFKCDSLFNQILNSAPILLMLILVLLILGAFLILGLVKAKLNPRIFIGIGILGLTYSLFLNSIFWEKYLFLYFFIPFLPSELNTGGGYGLIITLIGIGAMLYYLFSSKELIKDYLIIYTLFIFTILSFFGNDYSIVRYVIPIFFPLLIFSALVLVESQGHLKKLFLFFVILLLVFNLLMVSFSYKSYINPPFYTITHPFSSDSKDLNHYKPYFIEVLGYVNNNITSENILFYGNSVYLIENSERVYTYDSVIIQNIFENASSQEEVISELKNLGINYIFIEGAYKVNFLEQEIQWEGLDPEIYVGISTSDNLYTILKVYDDRVYSNPDYNDYSLLYQLI